MTAQLVAEYGEGDLAVLAHTDAPNTDHAQICRISTGLYEDVFTLPENEQLPLLRYMCTDAQENLTGGARPLSLAVVAGAGLRRVHRLDHSGFA